MPRALRIMTSWREPTSTRALARAPRASARWRQPLGNALLLVASLTISLACLELGLRIAEGPHDERADRATQPRDNEFAFYQYDSLLGWKNRPGAAGWFLLPDSRTYVRINSQGLRDIEHSYRPGATPRILVLGDSFTWGFGVERFQRFTDLVWRLVEPCVEIVNTGVAGYGTDQELLYYRTEGFKYSPRLVILAFTLNDVVNNRHPMQYTYPKPQFELHNGKLVLQNVPVPPRTAPWSQRYTLDQALPPRFWRVKQFLRDHLRSYAFFIDPIKSLVGHDIYKSESAIPDDPLTEALLLETRRDVESQGAKLTVVMVPDKRLVLTGRGRDTWEWYTRFLAGAGFHYVDLLPAFQEASDRGEELFFPSDPHWNLAGHRVAAHAIWAGLTRQGLIPANPRGAESCSSGGGIPGEVRLTRLARGVSAPQRRAAGRPTSHLRP